MKANDILNKIKNIVGVELSEKIELAELRLENGTILVSEEFTKGNAVFIKGEDGEIALPVGEYALEDGRILFIVEEGIIDSIKEAADEKEAEEDSKEEELSEDSVIEEKEETVETELEEEMQYVTKEEFALALEEIKGMIEKLYKENMSEEVSEEVTEEPVKEETKEELSAETVEPIKHNPEAETKNVHFTIAGKRTETTKDRVYNKIFNN